MEIYAQKIPNELAVYAQSRFELYISNLDLLLMIFEIHKNDKTDDIIYSDQFKQYEKDFLESYMEYKIILDLISEELVPNEYKMSKNRLKILDRESVIVIEESYD